LLIRLLSGQSSNICSQATATVQNGGDASALASCTTFSGSIAIATQATGDITFPGIETITGSLTAPNGQNVTSISAPNLATIGQALDLEQLTNVNALNFPNLTGVGSLQFLHLGPTLQSLGWTTGLKTVGMLNIQDTFLQNLNGINLTTASGITIANNQYLTDINIPLTSLSGGLNLNANAAGKAVATFGNLTTAGSIAISNCSSVNLMQLVNTTGSFAITSNSFTNLTLPAFTGSNGLIINNNNQMTSLSLPVYSKDAGSLNIQNNTGLTGSISMPMLTNVAGAANFIGAFNNLSTPELNTILGACVITSTADISSVCTTYNGIAGASSVIQGGVTCNSGKSTSSGSGTSSGSSSGASSTSSSTAKSAGDNIAAPTFTLLGALAAFFAVMA